jgi:tetratricopeptide (TPR) repeat protein
MAETDDGTGEPLTYWYDIIKKRVSHVPLRESSSFDLQVKELVYGNWDEYNRRIDLKDAPDDGLEIFSKMRIFSFGEIYSQLLLLEIKIKDLLINNSIKKHKITEQLNNELAQAKSGVYGTIKYALSVNITKNKIKDWFPGFIDDEQLIQGINPIESLAQENDLSTEQEEVVKAVVQGQANKIAAEEYFVLATEKVQMSCYEEAIEYYDKAIAKNPNYADAYHDRGHCKDCLQDYYGAILDFNKNIELDPDDVMSYYNRARSKYSLQDYSGVIEDNIIALELLKKNKNLPAYVPNNIKQLIYLNNGLSRNGLMEFELAINDFTEAIKLDPDFADAYQNRAVSNMCLQDPTEAIKDAERALELGNSAAQQIIDSAKSKVEEVPAQNYSIIEDLKLLKKIHNALKDDVLLGDILDEEEGWTEAVQKDGTKIKFFTIPTLDITILRLYHENGEIAQEQTITESTSEELLGIYPGYKKGWTEKGLLHLEQIAHSDGSSTAREWHLNGQLSLEVKAGEKKEDVKIRAWDEDGNPEEKMNVG